MALSLRLQASCRARIALLVLAMVAGAAGAADAPRFADPAKILRVSMDGEEAGFDPQGVGDVYSFTVVSAIFEAPYQYDYYGDRTTVCN